MKIGQSFYAVPPIGGVLVLLAACAGLGAGEPPSSPAPEARRQSVSQTTASRAVDPGDAARIQRALVPLLRVMDHPRSPSEVQVSIADDPEINAASAGSGHFVVTTGLLRKANDEQLQAVLAHEAAHDDLGHVARAEVLGTGVAVAAVLLDQIFPGSAQLTPIAGTLATRAYGRREEYQADQHGVELLRRAGKANGKEQMVDTLAWLMRVSGPSGGGFFATHPATGDRIDRLRRMA